MARADVHGQFVPGRAPRGGVIMSQSFRRWVLMYALGAIAGIATRIYGPALSLGADIFMLAGLRVWSGNRRSLLRSGLTNVCRATALLLVSAVPCFATFVPFHSQPLWLAAVGGASQATVFHFDGPTETSGKAANDPTIVP